ncbi:MAG: CPBP family intramembrane glutamic endopeptidase [Ktedonobacteraceae bacterium]
MIPEELRHPNNAASNGDLEGRPQAAGLLGLFRRHPVASAIVIFVIDIVIAVLTAIIVKAIVPPISMLPDFITLCIITIPTVILITFLGWWRIIGCNQPAEWRNLKLLLLPALLVLAPLVGGFKAVDVGTVVFLLVGYLLTGFYEEILFRGVLLRMLRPKGMWAAVLISSLLFGLIHSGNLFLRFSGNPVVVILQMIGAFTFGIGMAALRLRTNTIWPLMLLHAAGDLFLALGHLPVLLIDPIRDTILLVYGIYLLRSSRREELWADADTSTEMRSGTMTTSDASGRGYR